MQDEIKRLKEMLTKEDPRTPNYKAILDNLVRLEVWYEVECNGDCGCHDTESTPVVEVLPSVADAAEKKGKSAPTKGAETEPAPVVGEEPSEQAVVDEPPAPEYTIEEVRAAVKAAQTRGVDVRPFIAAYGVKNLSGVPKESFGELIEAVTNA